MPTRRRSGPRSRTRRPASRPRHRGRFGGVRQLPAGGRLDRASRGAPIRRGMRRRVAGARPRAHAGPRVRIPARRWSGAGCPRSPASKRTSVDLQARERPPRAGLPSRAACPTRSPALRERRRRSRERGRRRCRSCPRGAQGGVGSGRARHDRRRADSGRPATGHARARRCSAPEAARPCRREPAPRRAREPSVHRSPGPGAAFVRDPGTLCKERGKSWSGVRPPGPTPQRQAVADFGLRPRRATA